MFIVGISSQILIDIVHINNCNIFHDKNKNICINRYIIVIKGWQKIKQPVWQALQEEGGEGIIWACATYYAGYII